MVRLLIPALVLFVTAGAAFGSCSAGTPLLNFQLVVQPADGSQVPLPVRSVNLIQPGQKLIYAPVAFREGEEIEGKISVVLAPADPKQKLVVLKPHPAKATAEWEVPFPTKVVALVYGPNGLDAKKVGSLIAKDEELISQLADYAEQTQRTEQLLDALAAWDQSPSATENLNAALQGFSSSYGRSVPQVNWNGPMDQQVSAMIRALNPALASYDPLAPQPQQRMQQSAMLASSVAGLFFGSPVGLAAGGAAMFVNLSSMLFPNTSLRSAFVQEAPSHSMTLCAKRQGQKSRTRLAYLYAVRVPAAGPPAAELTGPAHLPAGAASVVDVRLGSGVSWDLLRRADAWKLRSSSDGAEFPVKVELEPEKQALRLDLTGGDVPPGAYELTARWDWNRFAVGGQINVHEIAGADEIELDGASQDRLVHGSGAVEVRIAGCDFQFLERADLRGPDGTTAISNVAFQLPKGQRAGPQAEVEVTIDTNELKPGDYRLALHFPARAVREVPLLLLPPHPVIEGLPLRVNVGELEQRIPLKGAGLERIESLEAESASLALDSDRNLIVRLSPEAKKGDQLDLRIKVEGVNEPLRIPEALEVRGPLPRIESAQVSLAGELGVALGNGELPAGSFASLSLHVEPLESPPEIRLACAEPELTIQEQRVRVGGQSAAARIRGAGANRLYVSLDPGLIGQSGCTLTAVAATETQGPSRPYVLGRVVRLPRIESFELTDEPAAEGFYWGRIEGEDLEMVEQVGWDSQAGTPVYELPQPVAGSGHKQALKVSLPWPAPSPHAPLYVWLRGETAGRRTQARY